MKFMHFRRCTACLLVVAQAFLPAIMLVSTLGHAQSLDTEAPVVGTDTIAESRKGDAQVFTVTATDNVGIESVILLYRFGENVEFTRANMVRVGETDLYTHTIPAEAIPPSIDVIQYYIEGKDTGGNRTVQGFSFAPLERMLIDRPATTVSDNTPQIEESAPAQGSLSTTQKVIYGALGLLVVGAIISAADDDGGDNTGASGPGVPVTILVDPLIRSR